MSDDVTIIFAWLDRACEHEISLQRSASHVPRAEDGVLLYDEKTQHSLTLRVRSVVWAPQPCMVRVACELRRSEPLTPPETPAEGG